MFKAQEVPEAHISIALVDDATIHEVNRRHLEHDYPTDVITFPYSPPGEPLEGEIVISTDHAFASSPRFHHDAEREALLYLIHGLLHLVGYRDDVPARARQMRRRQTYLLNRLVPRAEGSGEKGGDTNRRPRRGTAKS